MPSVDSPSRGTREHEVDGNQVGIAVEARYKQLGLTQESLAWLSGVSHTTIRNVLHGRIGVARTWPRIERALGWRRGSLNVIEIEETPASIIETEALKSLFAAFLRVAEKDEERGRELVDVYESFVSAVEALEGGVSTDYDARQVIQKLWPTVSSMLTPAETAPVIEAFQDFGWRVPGAISQKLVRQPLQRYVEEQGEDDLDVESVVTQIRTKNCGCPPLDRSLAESLLRGLKAVEHLDRDKDGLDAFRRLPIRVQQAFLEGDVVDSDVVPLPDAENVSIVTMVIRKRAANQPLSAEDRVILVNALRVWHMALSTSALTYDYFREHKWQPPIDLEKRVQEALKDALSGEMEIIPEGGGQ
jgi:transcriptional regulator with XRE-family HTH domain